MPVVIYSLLRLALFGAALALLLLVGARGWLVPLVAAVVAFGVSYVLFARQRDAAGAWMAQRSDGRRRASRLARAVEEDEAAEDAVAERLRLEQERRRTGPEHLPADFPAGAHGATAAHLPAADTTPADRTDDATSSP